MTQSLQETLLRRRIALLVLTDFLWGLGMYFVLPSTTMPAYLRSLNASPVTIGVLATVAGALPLLLQFYSRSVIGRFRHRKRALIIMHIMMISPFFLVATFDKPLSQSAPAILVTLIIAGFAFMQLFLGLAMPAWMDMIARTIPVNLRGRYFGMTSAAFAVGGILGGIGLTILQQRLGDGVFRGAYITAGICMLASMAAFALAPIPAEAFDHPPRPSLLAYVKDGLRASHPRTLFGRFVVSYAVQLFAFAVISFMTIFASDERGLHLPVAVFSRIVLWQAIGGAAGGFVLGWLVDHYGPRWPWVIITMIVPVVMLLLPFGRDMSILAVCSFLSGMLITHWSVGGPALLEFSPEGDKSGYVAAANLIALLPSVVGPLLFGMLIVTNGYVTMFTVAALAGAAALLVALTIQGRRNKVV